MKRENKEFLESLVGLIILISLFEMPDGIDIHDAYGIWVDNILVYKVKDRQKSEDKNAISDNE